jgi:perosamine synthetase
MSKKLKIPWSKPDFGDDEKQAILRVIESNWYSQGPLTKSFEDELSSYLDSNVSVVNSGTSALMCALLANGFQIGDKVLVPDFTFYATLSSAKILGAKIITADIDSDTLNLSPQIVEDIVKNNDIKFVIVVDVAGLPIDIDQFEELSKKYNFVLIEDAAQALGSEYKNKKIGSFDHTTTFSFHIAKQITTIEGGCVSSPDKKISEKIKQIRDHGRINSKNYTHDIIGSNFRTTDIQSSIGLEQIKKIDQYISRREIIANKYKKNIQNVSFQKFPNYSIKHSNMMFFTIYPNPEIRNKNFNILQENGIDVKLPWPPLHIQPANLELNNNVHEHTKLISDSALMLPIFNKMTDDEADYVIDCCNSVN